MWNSATNSKREHGFCYDCGSILPLLTEIGNVECYTCNRVYPPEVFGNMETQYVIHFNQYRKKDAKKGSEEETVEGPIVERKCPKCDCENMSYATLQLRSADEGQTVFYTCIKCKYKETENS